MNEERLNFRREATRYQIEYFFTVSQQTYHGVDEIPEKYYSPGRRIGIRYYPNNPDYNQPKDTYYTPAYVIGLILTVTSFVLFMVFLILSGVKRKKEKTYGYLTAVSLAVFLIGCIGSWVYRFILWTPGG